MRRAADAAAFLAAGDGGRRQHAGPGRPPRRRARKPDGHGGDGAPGEPCSTGSAELVPEEFSEHWQQTIEFLKIVTEAWPAHLAEKGLLSPAARRNRAILAEAERLAAAPPGGP